MPAQKSPALTINTLIAHAVHSRCISPHHVVIYSRASISCLSPAHSLSCLCRVTRLGRRQTLCFKTLHAVYVPSDKSAQDEPLPADSGSCDLQSGSHSWEMPSLMSEELEFGGGNCSRAHGWNLQHNNRNVPDCYPLSRAQPAGEILLSASLDREENAVQRCQRTQSGLDSLKESETMALEPLSRRPHHLASLAQF